MAIDVKLQELITQRNNLADNLNTMGVSANQSETLTTLVPKVLEIQNSSEETSPFISYYNTNTSAETHGRVCKYLFEIKELDVANSTSTSALFYGCTNLEKIGALLNFSNVKYMQQMFYNCSKLKAIPKLNTDIAISTINIFYGCSNITTIPEFNTSAVTQMEGMFYGCSKLSEIPLWLNTSSTTTTSNLFYNCSSLITIPELDFSNVRFLSTMFNGCTALTNLGGFLNLGKAFTTKSNNSSSYTLSLSPCKNLTHDSLMNVINNLYDLNLTYDVANGGTLYTQKLVLGSTNIAKLSSSELEICTQKGWVVS